MCELYLAPITEQEHLVGADMRLAEHPTLCEYSRSSRTNFSPKIFGFVLRKKTVFTCPRKTLPCQPLPVGILSEVKTKFSNRVATVPRTIIPTPTTLLVLSAWKNYNKSSETLSAADTRSASHFEVTTSVCRKSVFINQKVHQCKLFLSRNRSASGLPSLLQVCELLVLRVPSITQNCSCSGQQAIGRIMESTSGPQHWGTVRFHSIFANSNDRLDGEADRECPQER